MGDEALRETVRQNLQVWLEKLRCGGDVESKMEYKQKFIKHLKKAPVAINTTDANEQHYEVPTAFYLQCLGERMKYSSAIWPDNETTLEESEDAMLKLICKRAQVKDGQVIMDLGCGWGVTSLWILEKYPNCTVVAVSNSRTQKEFIEGHARDKGFAERLTCITADANVFDIEQRFDRIISIEMFEHMKNYQTLMKRVASWLKPEGLLFTQILCHKEFAYSFNSSKGSNTEWMARNFFSGGTMPSSDLFLYFQDDLGILDHWNINGKHYSKTLEAWLVRLDSNKAKAMEVLEASYGKDKAPLQMFNWRLFFIYCAEVFGYEDGNEWIVAHHLFEKRLKSSL